MLDINRINQFLPLQEVYIGSGGYYLLLLRKWLYYMEFEHPIEQLIHYLIYLFVGETHRLEIDLVIKQYL